MKVIVETTPSWILEVSNTILEDNDFNLIYQFYVLHTPCAELSSRSKQLSLYGWSMPWRKPFYLNRQLKQQAHNYDLLFSASKYDVLDEALQKCDLLQFPPINIEDERISFYDNKKNQFMSTFYHLRNGLAHGRFNIVQVDGDWVFILEDGVPSKNGTKVSARMIIRKSTLLRWRELIIGREKEYVKYQNESKDNSIS